MKDYFDLPTIVIIFITLILFVAALFTRGLTHNILLEAGVFLVSVKLILMGYRNSIAVKTILNEIKKTRKVLEEPSFCSADREDDAPPIKLPHSH